MNFLHLFEIILNNNYETIFKFGIFEVKDVMCYVCIDSVRPTPSYLLLPEVARAAYFAWEECFFRNEIFITMLLHLVLEVNNGLLIDCLGFMAIH